MEEKLLRQALLLAGLLVLHFVFVGGVPDSHTETVSGRAKRQYSCPSGCYSSCMNNAQCQRYQVATVCMLGCCCPQVNLSTGCDGDQAVAACLNGLCGQGYFCNKKTNFCCRCESGTSLGQCVNNMCPAGYTCNTNNYCCAIGSGSELEPCINDKCREGFVCGAGKLCYPVVAAGNTQ